MKTGVGSKSSANSHGEIFIEFFLHRFGKMTYNLRESCVQAFCRKYLQEKLQQQLR